MSSKKRMTRREYDEKVKELTKQIQEQAIAFVDDTAASRLKRIKRAKNDIMYFAETYFPHYIYATFADFHIEELKKVQTALDTTSTSICAESWFRGSGKSVLLSIILPIWAAITKRSYFTIISGADQSLASERTVAIRLELIFNGRIRYDYPDIAMDTGMGEEHDFVTPSGVRFLALGYKQAIKGKLHRRHRPRLIIIDDLEGHQDVSARIAAKKYEYITEEAFGAFGSKGGLLLWLGNLTNTNSALHRFIEKCKNEPNKYISYRIVPAITEEGESAWKAAYSLDNLNAKRAVSEIGFKRHYMMQPSIDGDIFKEEWFRFYNPFAGNNNENVKALKDTGFNMQIPTLEELRSAPIVSYCDPSLGAKETNDYKAIMTLAFMSGIYWILDAYVRKASILDMLDYMYDLDKRFKTRFYMETNFWQVMIYNYLPQKAVEMGYILPISGVNNSLKKEERILTLEPLFQRGHIVSCIVGKDYTLLKEQTVGFPNAEYDDAPDALAGAIARFREMAIANKYESVEPRRFDFNQMF